MSDPIPAFLILLTGVAGIQLALTGVVVYRLLAKRALDPLGHDARLQTVDRRLLALEMSLADMMRHRAQKDQEWFARLDEIRDTQSKMLGAMTSLSARVDSEAQERRQVTTRLDQITAAVANVASRFGKIESRLEDVLAAQPKSAEGTT